MKIFRVSLAAFAAVIFLSAVPGFAASFAVIAPDKSELSARFADSIISSLGSAAVDRLAAETAFGTLGIETPFNQTAEDARRAGRVIGADVIVLIQAEVIRRSAFGRDKYFEAAAALYVVSARTGRLAEWFLVAAEMDSEKAAAVALVERAGEVAARVRESGTAAIREDVSINGPDEIPGLVIIDTPSAAGVRAPMPYRRIRPEYTAEASRFRLQATVDAEVDIDAEGRVARIEFTRWAGYGLEGSVEKAIRTMNWRPGERSGKPLPARVLLRYNFTKVEREEP
ncbi:MAG: energy transducer TonB [Acidobacteria bacterium]|nr:energy transducer TonB [Acidobacteriota bacterium]